MNRQEIILPSCNLATVTDGRGGIFTWIPKEPIVEFNMLYFQPGKTRGHHYHPEFIEYFLIVDGQGVMTSLYKLFDPTVAYEKDVKDVFHMSKGMCVRTPIGIPHTFYAISAVTAVAMLTKKWDDCNPPIVQMEVK